MNCLKCGTALKEGDKFCSTCGAVVQNENNEEIEMLDAAPVINQNNSVSSNNDETLLDAFIGKNADKLKNGSFSVCTLFFGWIYALYRKLWLVGFLWLILTMIISNYVDNSFLINLAINIIAAFFFKKYYIKHAKEKVDKIKSDNPDKNENQLIMLCSQKGGTTIVPIVILSIFFVIGLVAIIILVVVFSVALTDLTNYSSIFDELNKQDTSEILDDLEDGNYGNIFGDEDDSSSNIINNDLTNKGTDSNKEEVSYYDVTIDGLTMKLPSDIVYNTNLSTGDTKTYTDSNGKCGVVVNKVDKSVGNEELKTILESNVNDSSSTVTTEIINNYVWFKKSSSTSTNSATYYATYKNDKTYITGLANDGNTSDCTKKLNDIKESMKLS